MATDDRNEVMDFLRTMFLRRLPEPTSDFRRRAWRTFETALERHLASRRATVREVQPQR